MHRGLYHSHIILPLLLTMRRSTSETSVALHNERLLDINVGVFLLVDTKIIDNGDRTIPIFMQVACLAHTACSLSSSTFHAYMITCTMFKSGLVLGPTTPSYAGGSFVIMACLLIFCITYPITLRKNGPLAIDTSVEAPITISASRETYSS